MDAELTLPLAFHGRPGRRRPLLDDVRRSGRRLVRRAFAVPAAVANRVGVMLQPHLGYHAGRVLAYTLLGALAAGIGQAIVLTGEVGLAQAVLYVVAGVG
jgi:sulfite exporter TauE/SafE